MATETAQPDDIFARVDSYDWDNDQEFQGGLQAILGSASSPEQVAHLTLRARCFYYSRKFGTKIDFDGYQAWRNQQHGSEARANTVSQPHVEQHVELPVHAEAATATATAGADSAPSALGNAPTPATFAEICQLIAEGKPIPGIKEIPDTVLEGQTSTSNVARRKKPWEKDVDPSAAAGE
ncbi:hypothetical protein K461DRAFT_291393 [Myriangium duriaei CBS 260.36]|uniref:Uncharacterized protein n=1 Tax=Myriangium duriaei CBS 260.36 TaxID=1168546 RepID=A0A9P4MNR9_9PEZI|nr:hypothetical protein K461DRAFT_291393 [Myriangium duriaei CBS 260.36]